MPDTVTPFFVTLMDLIVIEDQVENPRCGHRYLLPIMCARYGYVKIYALHRKSDVLHAWRQFQKWTTVASVHTQAKLGVKIQVGVVVSDRGGEFTTTYGLTRSEVDEWLESAGINRWSPSAGESDRGVGKIERFGRTLCESINVASRRGGAPNDYVYDAACGWFEHHYNASITDANEDGGRPPCESLGIPIDREQFVPFFCPAYIQMPEKYTVAEDVELQEKTSDHHFSQKKWRCFIIGYGGGRLSGHDSPGYRVVIPGLDQVYTSVHVTPQRDLRPLQSLITGLAMNPLSAEGVLARKYFDLDGKDHLTYHRIPRPEHDQVLRWPAGEPFPDTAAEPESPPTPPPVTEQRPTPEQDSADTDSGSDSDDDEEAPEPEAARNSDKTPHLPLLSGAPQTFGTGVGDQSRGSLKPHKEKTASPSNVMSEDDGRKWLACAFTHNWTLGFKSLSAAREDGQKKGNTKSAQRYDEYSRQFHNKPYRDFIAARKTAFTYLDGTTDRLVLSGDPLNDVVRGLITRMESADLVVGGRKTKKKKKSKAKRATTAGTMNDGNGVTGNDGTDDNSEEPANNGRQGSEPPPDPNGPDDMLQVNSMETTRVPTETVSGEADAAATNNGGRYDGSDGSSKATKEGLRQQDNHVKLYHHYQYQRRKSEVAFAVFQAQARRQELEDLAIGAAYNFMEDVDVDEGIYMAIHSDDSHDDIRDRFFTEISKNATDELGLEQPAKAWEALLAFHKTEIYIAFHKTEIYIDGIKKATSVKDAMRQKEWPQWRDAIRSECMSLIKQGVFAEVPKASVPATVRILPGTMLLDLKTVDGVVSRFKSRYVMRGDLSEKGKHYFESSSHQVKSKTMRMFYATSVAQYAATGKESYIPRFADVKTAFLVRKKQATDAKVWMLYPEWSDGLLPDRAGPTCGLLKKNLYGAADGSRLYEREWLEFIYSIGAQPTNSDRMCFTWEWDGKSIDPMVGDMPCAGGDTPSGNHELTVCTHVDDTVYGGSSDEVCDEFYRRMVRHFGECVGNTRAEFVLGLKVTWDLEKKTCTLSQRAHCEKILKEFGMEPNEVRRTETPLPTGLKAEKNDGERVPTQEFDYFGCVGSLNWLAVQTRPDLAGSVGMLGRYSQNPGPQHVGMARHVLRYIATHLDEGLVYHGNAAELNASYHTVNKCMGYVDADHGACKDTGRSTSGITIQLNGAAIIWSSRRQKVKGTSTAHSEMIALDSMVKEMEWVRDMMAELGFPQGCIRILEDNNSTLRQATGDYKTGKSDHYRGLQLYVENAVREGKVWIDRVDTKDQLADIHTKSVSPVQQFQLLRDRTHGKILYVPISQTVRDILDGKR